MYEIIDLPTIAGIDRDRTLRELDRLDCEDSLYDFIRIFWPVIEPETPFVGGWVLQAICEHLEAVTAGQITRLLINVFPGASKSITVSAAWPAWEWGPKNRSGLRYLCASYAQHLTVRDNRRFRNIVTSRLYRELWGDRVRLTGESLELVSNDRMGFKLASSVGGVGTGERADRVICLPYNERILTSEGPLPIGQIVAESKSVLVAGFDGQRLRWQKIETYQRNPPGRLVRIATARRSLRITERHRLITQNRGEVEAKDVKPGDRLAIAEALWVVRTDVSRQAEPSCETPILLPEMSERGGIRRSSPSEYAPLLSVWCTGLSTAGPSRPHSDRNLLQPQMPRNSESWRVQSYVSRWPIIQLRRLRKTIQKTSEKTAVLLFGLRRFVGKIARNNLRQLWEAFQTSYSSYQMLLSGLREYCPCQAYVREGKWSLRSWRSDDSLSSWMEQNVQNRDPQPRRQLLSLLRNDGSSTWESVARPSYRLCEGKFEPGEPDHGLPILPRENAWLAGRESGLAFEIVESVELLEDIPDQTFNLSVWPCHNYFAEGILVKNCDDPNKPPTDTDVGDSDVVMRTTANWFREVMPDRLNDVTRSAIVIIQQRISEIDVSGTVLDLGEAPAAADWSPGDYVHLSIPAEYDPSRRCVTVLGWEDPRSIEGDIAWPERFPEDALRRLRVMKGAWAWCTPGESPILMADLSLKPIKEIKEGDEIVGFSTNVSPTTEGERFSRRKLLKATVLGISKTRQPIVKITLDSGAIVRCTENHKWYTRQASDVTHSIYNPAKVGRYLLRVTDIDDLDLTIPEDIRNAGWLAGFFDGEGSVTLQKRREQDHPIGLISFSQNIESNMMLCEKLERVLTHFGFDYGYKELDRSQINEKWKDTRWYYLRGNSIPMYRKWLFQIRPEKWRDRVITAALGGANFVIGKERVVSIEPDGVEDAYGLQTTSGNYIVWGFASENSSQYQQLVVPRGGGIIKDEWWQLWTEPDFPPYGTCIASLDTAYKEHQLADYSALTVWAAFEHPETLKPKLMLRAAWQERCNLAELCRLVIRSCREHKVDVLLIEDAARGIDVRDEVWRLIGTREIRIQLIPPIGDKVARLNACVPVFENGVVYAPDKEWADMVIRQVSNFPRGRHDDLVDSVAQSIIFLRKTGVAVRREEHDAEILARRVWRKPARPVYDV